MNIYQQQILDHYHHPRNSGDLPDYTHTATVENTTCGDSITLFLKVIDGKIKRMAYAAEGCAISIAAASLLSDAIVGKTIAEVQNLDMRYMLTLLGIDLSSGRLKCGHLPLQAAQSALASDTMA